MLAQGASVVLVTKWPLFDTDVQMLAIRISSQQLASDLSPQDSCLAFKFNPYV
jgi:hypothetical protein